MLTFELKNGVKLMAKSSMKQESKEMEVNLLL